MNRLILVLLIGLTAAAAAAQETMLATVRGDGTHDVVAQCLMRQMPPRFRAFPRVAPPPSKDAVVNMFVRGHDEAEEPIGIFHIRPIGSGELAIFFTQVSGTRGEYDRIARIAAQRCAN